MRPPGPSVNVYDPLVEGGVARQRIDYPEGYSHTIQANGGFWSASFSVAGSVSDADEWLQNGLMRHVVAWDDALGRCWEGFVNSVEIAYGPLTVTAGPLLDVANRVDLYYSTVDNSTIPPTVGIRAATGITENTVSQGLYGVRTKILSTGGATAANAIQIRDTYLVEYTFPKVTKKWQTGQGKPPVVKVNCLGYVHMLDYPYNQTAATAPVTTSVKILAVLAANPNIAWLAFGTAGVATPASPAYVHPYENDNNPAWEVIMDAVARGDDNGVRWTFGIYGELGAQYASAPTTAEYHQMLGDPAQRVTTPAGAEVPPWSVRPAKWLLFPDLLAGYAEPSTLVTDPRAMFIESVTYTAPRGLQLAGGRLDKLSTMLAKLGLSGIGG